MLYVVLLWGTVNSCCKILDVHLVTLDELGSYSIWNMWWFSYQRLCGRIVGEKADCGHGYGPNNVVIKE